MHNGGTESAGPVFQFRFQKLLDVEGGKQRGLELEMAGLDSALVAAEAELDRWLRTRRGALQDIRRARLKGDMEQNARSADYLRHVRSRLERCRETIAQLNRTKDEVRLRLERAMQSCKLLENYRDRLKHEFMLAQEKSEEHVLDLLSMRRHMQAERAS